MLACVTTFALEGVSSHEVTVEVDVRRGLPTFTLVGLPDRAIRESRERVRAALLNSGLDFPQKRLTVNLAPAHVRKAGPSFDLPIAIGILIATGQVSGEFVEDAIVTDRQELGRAIGRSAFVQEAVIAAADEARRRLGRELPPPPQKLSNRPPRRRPAPPAPAARPTAAASPPSLRRH